MGHNLSKKQDISQVELDLYSVYTCRGA